MSRSISRLLSRVRELTEQGCVYFTKKAYRELTAFDEPLTETDALDVVATLTKEDFAKRIKSRATGEPLYIFKPQLGEILIYVKLLIRDNCIIISFHEDIEAHA